MLYREIAIYLSESPAMIDSTVASRFQPSHPPEL